MSEFSDSKLVSWYKNFMTVLSNIILQRTYYRVPEDGVAFAIYQKNILIIDYGKSLIV